MKKYTKRQMQRAVRSERVIYRACRHSAFDLKYCVRESPFKLVQHREDNSATIES